MTEELKLETRPDKVVIKGGKVISVEHWVNWNGQLWQTLLIERESDDTFFCCSSDPEHGGGSTRGRIDEVMEWLSYHPKIAGPIHKALELKEATVAAVKAAGLDGYEVEMQ